MTSVVKNYFYRSQLLRKTLGIDGKSDGGLFPDLVDELKFFDVSLQSVF